MVLGYMVFVDQLKQKGYKLTKPRLVLLRVLGKQRRPVLVLDLVKKVEPYKIDQATVYRTLDLFAQLGFVHSEEMLGKTYYYLSRDPHHHVICQVCKRIKCLPCKHYSQHEVAGFSAVSHRMTFEGVCEKCSAVKP